jgi:hypothetical protein
MKLNEPAHEHAQKLIAAGKVVLDGRDDWSEHQPSAEDENRYIAEHGIDEYARWFLGIDEGQPEEGKGRYKFPYGDFEKVHRCALLAAESRAGQYKYLDIKRAAHQLHKMVESQMQGTAQGSAQRS